MMPPLNPRTGAINREPFINRQYNTLNLRKLMIINIIGGTRK
jgi:hypothetical protein